LCQPIVGFGCIGIYLSARVEQAQRCRVVAPKLAAHRIEKEPVCQRCGVEQLLGADGHRVGIESLSHASRTIVDARSNGWGNGEQGGCSDADYLILV